MGVFFYTNSVALIEDIPLEEEYNTEGELRSAMDAGFQQVIYWTKIEIRELVFVRHVIRNWNFSSKRHETKLFSTYSISRDILLLFFFKIWNYN